MAGTYERKDHFYQEAKAKGYRSRAAFKLIEINNKYGIIKNGMHVLDLGAWPGGWLQVASQKVGRSGIVVGIDLVQIEEVGDNVKIICSDANEDNTLEQALAYSKRNFDVLISDMSPKITGIREVDQAASVHLAELSLFVAERALIPDGNFVIKVFKGNDTEVFIRSARPRFTKLVRAELKSSRKTSSEFYIIGFGFKG